MKKTSTIQRRFFTFWWKNAIKVSKITF